MPQMRSWRNLGKRGGASFLDNWRKDPGYIDVVPHRDPPWERYLHNFNQILEKGDDKTKEKTLSLGYLPFVCHEDEAFHKARRFGEAATPKQCPACKFLDWLEASKIGDDDLVFVFEVGRTVREYHRLDLLGGGKHRDSFMEDFRPKSDFLLSVIQPKKPDEGVRLTNEKWSLISELDQQIQFDVRELGEDEGDPSRRPICYTFKYNEDARKYGISRNDRVQISEAVRELWAGPAPDVSRFVNASDPYVLLAAFKDSLQFKVPLEDFFGAACRVWDAAEKKRKEAEPDRGEEEAPTRPPSRRSEEPEEERPARRSAPREEEAPARRSSREEAPARRSVPERDEAPARRSARDDEAPRRSSREREEEAPARRSAPREEEAPARRSAREEERPARRSVPERDEAPARRSVPEKEPEKAAPRRAPVAHEECGDCGGRIPAGSPKCPLCGVELDPPEDEPAPASTTTRAPAPAEDEPPPPSDQDAPPARKVPWEK